MDYYIVQISRGRLCKHIYYQEFVVGLSSCYSMHFTDEISKAFRMGRESAKNVATLLSEKGWGCQVIKWNKTFGEIEKIKEDEKVNRFELMDLE